MLSTYKHCLPHLRQRNVKHSYPYPEGPNKFISEPLFSIRFSLVPLSYSHAVSQWSAVWLCMVTCKWSMRWTSVSPDLRNVVQCLALMPDRQEHTQVHLTQLHLSYTEADKPETYNRSVAKIVFYPLIIKISNVCNENTIFRPVYLISTMHVIYSILNYYTFIQFNFNKTFAEIMFLFVMISIIWFEITCSWM